MPNRPTAKKNAPRPGSRAAGRRADGAVAPTRAPKSSGTHGRAERSPAKARPTASAKSAASKSATLPKTSAHKPAAHKPAAAPAPSTAIKAATRVKWSGFKVLLDFWGQPMKRYYQLETLASAVEVSLTWRNSFVFRSVHEVLGAHDVLSLHFELFQEGRYQLIFRLHAVNVKGKSAQFALVAAKNHEECSKIAETEHHNLRTLYTRMPKFVVRPHWGGQLFLPDRHRRKEHDRHIYAYLTGWLNGYEEMGVTRSLQFYVNAMKKHTFTLAETEVIKGEALEIVAASHDPRTRTAMELPQIASGDFVVSRDGPQPRIKLIACRRMQRNVTRHKLLAQVLTESWEWGGRTFKLAPEDPATVLAALTRVWGKEEARACVRAYLDGVAAGRLPGKKPGYLADLRALCEA